MPNHYTNLIQVIPGGDDDGPELEERLTAAKWGDGPLARVRPVRPVLSDVDAQTARWGCKWDAYDVHPPIRLPGDCRAVLLTFSTAWCAPNDATRDAIARELIEVYGAKLVVWTGLDPYDDSWETLGRWNRSDRFDAHLAPAKPTEPGTGGTGGGAS